METTRGPAARELRRRPDPATSPTWWSRLTLVSVLTAALYAVAGWSTQEGHSEYASRAPGSVLQHLGGFSTVCVVLACVAAVATVVVAARFIAVRRVRLTMAIGVVAMLGAAFVVVATLLFQVVLG